MIMLEDTCHLHYADSIKSTLLIWRMRYSLQFSYMQTCVRMICSGYSRLVKVK